MQMNLFSDPFSTTFSVDRLVVRCTSGGSESPVFDARRPIVVYINTKNGWVHCSDVISVGGQVNVFVTI